MEEYNLVSVIKTIHRWRKPLLGVTLGAAVISVIVSLFLPNIYLSTTIFYAASQDLFKPQKVFGYSQSEMYYYGSGEDIQRVLTVSASQPVLNHLIDSFGLFDHYGIDKSASRADNKIKTKLLDRYSVIRTKYDALELSIEDTDPELAAGMANSARSRINALLCDIIKSSQRDLISSYGSAIKAKELALIAVQDSLQKYQGLYGIYDTEAQSEYLSTLITSVETDLVRAKGSLESFQKNKGRSFTQDTIVKLNATISGLEMQKALLTGVDTTNKSAYNLNKFTQGKGRVELYTDAYDKAVGTLNMDREMLKQMEAAVALDVPAIHLVEAAAVPDIKIRPKRSIIVIATTFIALLFTVFGILVFESLRKQDWSFMKW